MVMVKSSHERLKRKISLLMQYQVFVGNKKFTLQKDKNWNTFTMSYALIITTRDTLQACMGEIL